MQIGIGGTADQGSPFRQPQQFSGPSIHLSGGEFGSQGKGCLGIQEVYRGSSIRGSILILGGSGIQVDQRFKDTFDG